MRLLLAGKAILAAAIAAAAAGAGAQQLAMKESAGFRWVCGGVGAEERAALAALRPRANLEILFVTAKRGGYLADAELSVRPAGAVRAPLQVTAEGPICLVSAPPGRYRIEGVFGGNTRGAEAAAGARPGAPARVVLAFPGEPWDGIWADRDEKQEARRASGRNGGR